MEIRVIDNTQTQECDILVVNKFLNEHKILVKDIKEVYVGRGPGSYTGLRIAGTVGKVFAHINNKKLKLEKVKFEKIKFEKVKV